MIIVLLLAAIASGVALFVWWANRSIDEWKAQREAALARAKVHIDSGSAFGQGAAAALQGDDFWANPHCTPTGMKEKGLAWNAGWCYGRQQLRDIGRAKD